MVRDARARKRRAREATTRHRLFDRLSDQTRHAGNRRTRVRFRSTRFLFLFLLATRLFARRATD
jgi:hypothetical protein